MKDLTVCPSTLQEGYDTYSPAARRALFDFEEFGKRIGLPAKVIKQEIDMFATEKPQVKELLGRSFLSPSLQEQYWMAFDYRRKMLNF